MWEEAEGRRGVQARAAGGIRASRQTRHTPAAWACLCRDTNVRFSAELRRLQSLPKCERLPLPSFLLLPFQRITRLRMLLQVPALAPSLPCHPAAERSRGLLPLPPLPTPSWTQESPKSGLLVWASPSRAH